MTSSEFKENRLKMGYTQDEMGDFLGVSKRQVANFENGNSIVKEIYAEKITSFLANEQLINDVDLLSLALTESLTIPRLNLTAQAGTGNSLDGVESFEVVEQMVFPKSIFKTPPKGNLKIIKVDGYSMVPMLFPDSYVIFDETEDFKGDGLYILNWGNELMVKQLQVDPQSRLHIKSANPDYQSWIVEPDNQTTMKIVGKVLRVIL
jgi:phage repressor protein C with HTH and peptisase S24 domain